MSLTTIIIAKNAQSTIQRCLKSITFADEIILIDSGSTDQTMTIARQHNVTILQRKWPGYGAQKNFGLSQAQGNWVLFIDADEEVTPKLAAQIKQITSAKPSSPSDTKYRFYWLRIITIFLNRPLNHLYGHNLRLFKKTAGRWTDAAVHEQVQTVSGQVITLGDQRSTRISTPLIHHSHQTIKSYLKTMHRYTTLDAQQMVRTNKHRSGRAVKPTWFLPWHLGSRQFIKLYFYRHGFLDGYAGFLWCVLSGYYEYEMATKFLKVRNSKLSSEQPSRSNDTT